MRFDNRILVLLIPPGILIGLILVGVAKLLLATMMPGGHLGFTHYTGFFARSDYVAMLVRTLVVAGATTLICLVLSYPVAFFIARFQGRRDLLLFLVAVPWLVSLIVRTYGWIVLLGNRGLINGLLAATGLVDRPLPLMFNTNGVLVGMVHVFCPFMILAILTSFLHLERSLEEAAMSLGAGPVTTFRRVVLPLTLPGVMSGTIIVFLMSTGAVVTPLMLGGVRDALLGTQIYRDVLDMFDIPEAATVAVILTLSVFAVVLPLQWLERRVSRHLKPQAG